MKMNIKGLVFVGFAAAVFASAANAADKVVTSKQYVDGKIVQTLTDGDTTHAPSADKVHDELALKQNIHISDNASDHGKTLIVGDTGDITISDVSAVDDTNTTYTISSSQTTDGSITVTPSEGNAYDVAVPGLAAAAYKAVDNTISDDNATSTNLPTTQAVYNYIDGEIGDNVGEGTLSISIGGGNPTTFSANEATGSAKSVALGSAAGADTTTDTTLAASGETGKLPTAATVKTYVDSKVGSAYDDGTNVYFSTGANGETVVNAATIKLNGTAVPMDATTHEIALTDTQYSADDVTIQKNASNQFSAKTGAITSTATTLVDGQTVYNFVTTPTNILPTNAECTGTQPCALVFDGTNVTWEKIQQ